MPAFHAHGFGACDGTATRRPTFGPGEAYSELARSPLGLPLQIPAQVSLAQTAATALSSKSRT